MPDNYATLELADIKGMLAEKVFVACPIRQDSWDDVGGTHPPVCDCQGSGKRWLLRGECPGPNGYGCHDEECTRCSGLMYVFNDAEDAIPEAIAAMGWTCTPSLFNDGWMIGVGIIGSFGRVNPKEGITSLTHALAIGLLRALDSQA